MSNDGNFKHELFSEFARIGKALSSPNRLELLEFLAQGPRSVEALARAAGLTTANTSAHLQLLRRTGLVTVRKEGQSVYYRLTGGDVVALLSSLRQVAEAHLAEVTQLVNAYLAVKDSLEPLPAAELLSRVREGLVTVIDVRPPEEYAAGHVPGALSIPLATLGRHLSDLSRSTEIVAYCRGPYCVLAYEAVAQLRQKGFTARRLEEGFPEWKQAGLPVDIENKEDAASRSTQT